MDREMASTAPISQPSQYMMATTRQITPDKHQHNLNVQERMPAASCVCGSVTYDGGEHGQQQQRMSSKHRHGGDAHAQRQQETPQGTLHPCQRTPHLQHIQLRRLSRQTWRCVTLTYHLREDLLPVLAGLKTSPQGRRLWEGRKLLLDEGLPVKEVRVALEGGFPPVRGLPERNEPCQQSTAKARGQQSK